MSRNWLEEQDMQRIDEPERVALALESELPRLNQTLHPLFCTVYGATLRRLGRLAEARAIIRWGIKITKEPNLLAKLYQRLAYLEGDEGKYDLAIRFTELAHLSYSSAGNIAGVGLTYVDQGIWQYKKGFYKAANSILTVGLEFLPETKNFAHVRYSAILTRGFCFEALGDSARAIKYTEEAARISHCVGVGLRISMWWLKARLARRTGNLGEAEEVFSQILAHYTEGEQPLFAAKASVEVVAVKLELGEVEEALKTANAMVSYLTPLQDNRIAAATITELLRSTLTGRLTQTCIAAARVGLERAEGRISTPPTLPTEA